LKEKKKLIEGPSVLVDEILKLNNASSISNLVEDFDLSIAKKEKSPLYIETLAHEKKKIWKSPRVGLTLQTIGEEKENYVMKHLRFQTFPELQKKGKVNTFIGMHHHHKLSPKEIEKFSKTNASVISNYIDNFESGKKMKLKKFEKQKINPELLCQMSGCISMM